MTDRLTGFVLYPGDPGWDDARRGFASWAPYDANKPEVIVFCQDTGDVANAVKWARSQGKPFRIRSGRHNYEAFSSLVQGGLIIDVSDMDLVRASSREKTAEVGAGITMLDLCEALGEAGVAIPLATGPTVGIAGLTLGGGFGVTSRKWGLTCDHLTNVEMVTASGEVIDANEQEHADLFWACQGGGGGSFGVATKFTFNVHKVSNVAAFNISWTWDQFENVVERWQAWAPEADDGISSILMLTVTNTISMYGQFTANRDEELPRVSELLKPMLDKSAPIAVNIQIVPFIVAARMFFGVDPANPQWRVHKHSGSQVFKSTSAFAYSPFSRSGIRKFKQHLESAPKLSVPPSQPSMVQLLGAGGFPSRIPPRATAAFHRQAKFIVQYDAYWTDPHDGPKTLAWANRFRRAMQPFTRGAYVNYSDREITDWQRAYYGDNLERLVEVKQTYDSENMFCFPQSIPTSMPAGV